MPNQMQPEEDNGKNEKLELGPNSKIVVWRGQEKYFDTLCQQIYSYVEPILESIDFKLRNLCSALKRDNSKITPLLFKLLKIYKEVDQACSDLKLTNGDRQDDRDQIVSFLSSAPSETFNLIRKLLRGEDKLSEHLKNKILNVVNIVESGNQTIYSLLKVDSLEFNNISTLLKDISEKCAIGRSIELHCQHDRLETNVPKSFLHFFISVSISAFDFAINRFKNVLIRESINSVFPEGREKSSRRILPEIVEYLKHENRLHFYAYEYEKDTLKVELVHYFPKQKTNRLRAGNLQTFEQAFNYIPFGLSQLCGTKLDLDIERGRLRLSFQIPMLYDDISDLNHEILNYNSKLNPPEAIVYDSITKSSIPVIENEMNQDQKITKRMIRFPFGKDVTTEITASVDGLIPYLKSSDPAQKLIFTHAIHSILGLFGDDAQVYLNNFVEIHNFNFYYGTFQVTHSLPYIMDDENIKFVMNLLSNEQLIRFSSDQISINNTNNLFEKMAYLKARGIQFVTIDLDDQTLKIVDSKVADHLGRFNDCRISILHTVCSELLERFLLLKGSGTKYIWIMPQPTLGLNGPNTIPNIQVIKIIILDKDYYFSCNLDSEARLDSAYDKNTRPKAITWNDIIEVYHIYRLSRMRADDLKAVTKKFFLKTLKCNHHGALRKAVEHFIATSTDEGPELFHETLRYLLSFANVRLEKERENIVVKYIEY